MNKTKILWSLIFIAIVIAIIVFFVSVKPNKNETVNTISETFNKETANDVLKNQENIEYIKMELSDGILYSINGEKAQSDIVLGDNYFDTTINDMYFNPENYFNKNIEIEGMYLGNLSYTFVGRYSTSNLCPYCPTGYSYLEYQLQGNIDAELKDEQTWIKVIGTLEKGNDETSLNQDYYYLKVINLEIMNEKGNDTVKN